MRLAVTYDNGQVFQHFGHTEQFKIYDIENKEIVQSKVVDTNGNGHDALGYFLASYQVNALICGGIGGGAQKSLAEAGIILFAGVTGSVDDAVQALLDGTLEPEGASCCGHHGEGHSCGHHGESHGCGQGHCHS